MDGEPFADTQTGLVASPSQVFNSIRFDENGTKLDGAFAFTGLNADLTLSIFTCSNWTTNASGSTAASNAMYGISNGGPGEWLSGRSNWCSVDAALICLGKAKTAQVIPTVRSGKKIWQSTGYTVGAQTPDVRCQADRPAGVATGVAFLSFNNRAASTVLSPTTLYLRPDGVPVGTGALLAAGGELDSGIWQYATGEYSEAPVRSGSALPTAAGTDGTTCANWTSQTGTSQAGWSSYDVPAWWSGSSQQPCNVLAPLYCVEP